MPVSYAGIPYSEVILFNITDKNNVLLSVEYSTIANHAPHIGLYPKDNPALCVLKREYDDNEGGILKLYKIANNRLIPVTDSGGQQYHIKYTYDKWAKEPFQILERNTPDY
jgi:hypothetical protein